MLSGYKTSDDLIMLDSGRRVATSHVWILRIIAVVLVISALARATTGGPAFAMGAIIGSGVVYMIGLRLASSTDGSD